MGHLFSSQKKRPSRITQQDEAVLQLKTQRDKLKMYTKKLEGSLDRERGLAKQLIANGKKDRALLLLKKKRLQETLIERTMRQQANLEQMIHDLEFAQVEMEVLDKLKMGNEALHKIHRLVSVEDAERIMSDAKEAQEYQAEIDSIISGELSTSELDDCERELSQLLQDNADELKEALPEVPSEALPEVEGEEAEASPKASKEKRRRSKEPQLVPA